MADKNRGGVHPKRIFKKASELLKAWNDYKEHKDAEAQKWRHVQYVGRDGQRVEDFPPMPYTLDGFISWYHNKYNKNIEQYFTNTSLYEDEFFSIVTHIRAERNDNVKTGVLTGHFNSSMGNRIVGLAEKTDNNTTHNVKLLNIDPLDDSDDNTKDNE